MTDSLQSSLDNAFIVWQRYLDITRKTANSALRLQYERRAKTAGEQIDKLEIQIRTLLKEKSL